MEQVRSARRMDLEGSAGRDISFSTDPSEAVYQFKSFHSFDRFFFPPDVVVFDCLFYLFGGLVG